MLKMFGYDFEVGWFDEIVYFFVIGLNLGDVCIMIKYVENDFWMVIFGMIYECGYVLYE